MTADREFRDMERMEANKAKLANSTSSSSYNYHPKNPNDNKYKWQRVYPKRQYEENRYSQHNSYNQYETHPIYYEISNKNGEINRMDLSTMKNQCKLLGIDTKGKLEAVKRRLKEYHKIELLESAGFLTKKNVDFLIVVDFEATCEERNPQGYPHEIIEFPAVLVDTQKKEIVDEFHSYIRPLINPKLSEFCRTLTGISQQTVDKSDSFLIVHERFMNWIRKHELGRSHSFCIVTDGPFDMGRFLYLQTGHSKLDYPNYGTAWVNLRKCFANFYKSSGGGGMRQNNDYRLPGLQSMLTSLGMKFEGSPHSGIDDARNIARIVIKMLKDRAFLRINEKIVLPESGSDYRDPTPHHPGRLQSVISVSHKEAEKWYSFQQKIVNNNHRIENKQEENKSSSSSTDFSVSQKRQ